MAGAALYHGLFAASATSSGSAEAAGRYLNANPAATALLGYTRAELLDLGVAEVVAACSYSSTVIRVIIPFRRALATPTVS